MTEQTDSALGGSDPADESRFSREDPARILPLVTATGDRTLLEEWIEGQAEYQVVPDDIEAVSVDDFDLCILDPPALEANLGRLQDWKDSADPVVLPYLLFYPESDASIVEMDRGALADNVLRSAIDEVVTLPLKKAELAWRVEALLRLRSQSLQLHAEKQQLRRFKLAAEAAGHAIYMTDTDGTIEYVNPAFERLTGYEAPVAIGETPQLLNSGEMSDAYFEALWERISAGETWDEVVVNRRADGELYYADQTIAPIRGPADTIEGYVAIQADITARQELEHTLQQYKQAVDSSKDLLAAVDENFEFLFANREYRRFHAVDSLDIAGRSLAGVIGDEEFAAIEPRVRTALAGRAVQTKIDREDPERGSRTLDLHLFPLRDADGDIRGVGASMRDITERERLRETLSEAKERYESLFNSMRDAILVADTDRKIINCNPAFTDLFGYELAEIEGKHTKYVYETEAEFEELGAAIEGHVGDPQFVHTVQYQKKSGQTFPGETTVFNLRNADDEVVGKIGVIRDVTGRETRLQQLQKIDRVLQHNFLNAMNVILGNADILRESVPPEDARVAEQIIETGDQLMATVDKEHDITSFLSDPPAVEVLDSGRAITQAVTRVSSAFPNADISTTIPDRIAVRASLAIEDAIEELLTNSIIHADTEEPQVDVAVSTDRDLATITVTDENQPIPEMERDVLSGREPLNALSHGSGLGLWLVKLVVDHSDGVLTIEAGSDNGNVVRIDLPRA